MKIYYFSLTILGHKHPGLDLAKHHRRRMETEAKAKVVASVWRAEFIQFIAALAVLPRSIWKKGWIHHILPNEPRQNSYSIARKILLPETDATTFGFASLSILLLMLLSLSNPNWWLPTYFSYYTFLLKVIQTIQKWKVHLWSCLSFIDANNTSH